MAKNSATAAAPTSLAKRRQASTLKAAAVFLAPIFILIAIFIVYPIIDNFKTSFYQWNGISANKVWVGLDPYILVCPVVIGIERVNGDKK